MVQPTYPGVYIVEKPSGVRSIAGVATSIGAFFGRASSGPINHARRIFSFGDYARDFGEPHPESDLADSVRLFFANGGTEAYVIRLANGARAASVTMRSLALTGIASRDVLVATAKAEGTHGNTIRIEVDYDTLHPDDTFNMTVVVQRPGQPDITESHTGLSMEPGSPRFAPSFVTASSAHIDVELAPGLGDPADPSAAINNITTESRPGFSQARRPLGAAADIQPRLDALINPAPGTTPRSRFDISVNGSEYATVDLAPWPVIPTTRPAILLHINARINAAVDTVQTAADVTATFVDHGGDVGNLLTLTSSTVASPQSRVRVRAATSNDIAAALLLGVDQGGFEFARWSNFRPAPTATFLTLHGPAGATHQAQFTNGLNRLADLRQDALTSITIDGEQVVLNDPTGFNLQTTGAADQWFESDGPADSVHSNNDGVREKLRIIARAINANPLIRFRAELWGYHLALVATDGDVDNQPATIVSAGIGAATEIFDLADTNTRWVSNARRYSLGTANAPASASVSNQVDGDDGGPPEAADYLGNEAAQTGLHALDPVDLFNLMVLPGDQGVSQATLEQVLGPAGVYCRSRRAFLLIDPPKGPDAWTDPATGRPTVVQDTTLANNLRNLLGAATDHAAVFYPNLLIPRGPALRRIGPSGAIAGLMARTDAARGVWKAPAGTEARINAINGLEVVLTDAENGVLNPVAVNCLRVLPAGFVNWGARTLAGTDAAGSEWKYIPIRRLALFIEESLYRGTHWVVFEPNDEPLWAKIRLNVGAFMTRLFRQGAFQGSSPSDAFFVKCDAETTPQADRDLGIVNIVVGFAPLKPAEFVIITIQQIAGDL